MFLHRLVLVTERELGGHIFHIPSLTFDATLLQPAMLSSQNRILDHN